MPKVESVHKFFPVPFFFSPQQQRAQERCEMKRRKYDDEERRETWKFIFYFLLFKKNSLSYYSEPLNWIYYSLYSLLSDILSFLGTSCREWIKEAKNSNSAREKAKRRKFIRNWHRRCCHTAEPTRNFNTTNIPPPKISLSLASPYSRVQPHSREERKEKRKAVEHHLDSSK